jgi:hypothetical protein
MLVLMPIERPWLLSVLPRGITPRAPVSVMDSLHGSASLALSAGGDPLDQILRLRDIVCLTPVSLQRAKLPNASTEAWIWVLSPPCEGAAIFGRSSTVYQFPRQHRFDPVPLVTPQYFSHHPPSLQQLEAIVSPHMSTYSRSGA